jgi:hypothetical protein
VESKIVNKSKLFYETKYSNSNLNEYYLYILNDIILFLTKNNIPHSINFGCNNIFKDINLDFQYEHTITNNGNGSYSCVVHRFEELIKLESVFEYSKSNINNIKTSNYFNKYSDNFRYYPALIYDINSIDNISDRVKNCLTIHNSNSRRNNIHQKVNMDYYHNVCGDLNVYCKNIMKNFMDKYKVLVNIHQTDKYCTLEELRVLPALMTGILVISEESPYKEHIPYHEHIIWSTYNNMAETINNVLENYDFFRQKYLTNLNLTLKKMKDDSDNEMSLIFKNYIV